MSCVKNYHFFTAPRWSEKALFCTLFFSEYWFWSQVGASGVVYLSFFRIYGEKMIIFQHNDILRNFRIQTFLDFWIFWLKSLLRLFGSVFHGSQGSMAKCEEIRMIFFWKCHVWKITIFSQPRGGQKRHFFAQFFLLWIWILITGRCIWGGLFEFFENLWWKKW